MTESNAKLSVDIAQRITEAILAQKLAPGARLGEQSLAELFGVSRTLVREALTRLAARGMVTVSARRGWYLIEPSDEDIADAFHARRLIEAGLLREFGETRSVPPLAIPVLKRHIARERAAIDGDDAGLRSFLLGDFHVCLCECIGNPLLTDTLRDLTARTTMIASRQQSAGHAGHSCAQHEHIVDALAQGNGERAAQLMEAHLADVQAGLRVHSDPDRLARLRRALAPLRETLPP